MPSRDLVKLVAIVILGIVVTACGATAATGLGVGIVVGIANLNPDRKRTKKWQGLLLNASVTALGSSLNLAEAAQSGLRGAVATAILIGTIIGFGLLVARFLKVDREEAFLISIGTAICGGSAIAAAAAVMKPKDSALGVSLAIVFILNAIALVLLPPVGRLLHMSEPAFGWWAAMAIHDTSSVVGAASEFGPTALKIATMVKLTRALWILPVVLVLQAHLSRQARRAGNVDPQARGKVKVPLLVPGFILVSALFSFIPQLAPFSAPLSAAARKGFVMSLFLVGAGISWKALRQTAGRPLILGLVLWAFALVATWWPALFFAGELPRHTEQSEALPF